jgi:hypothetical protein
VGFESAVKRIFKYIQSTDCTALEVEYVTKLRAKHKKEPGWLDAVLPALPFTRTSPANFAFQNVMRELIALQSITPQILQIRSPHEMMRWLSQSNPAFW